MNKVIVFDGVCLLCNRMVNLLIKWDKKKNFRYSTTQGEFVKQLKIEESMDSIIFYDEGEIYYKSTAILHIAYSLGGLWTVVNIFYLIPTSLRDILYDTLAKYRYKIFGKTEHCRLVKEEEQELFID